MISLRTPGNTMINVKTSQKLNTRSSLTSVREKRSIFLLALAAFTLPNRRIMPFTAAPSSHLYTAQLVQRRLLWVCHTTRRPQGGLTRNLLLSTPPRMWHRRTGTPSQDVDNRAKGKPGTPLRTASLRLRSMQTGLGKNFK